MSFSARVLLALIQLYKWTLSPLIGRDCRYLPTCSSYAADAIRAHGSWAGSWMALARLSRCHPFGGSGWDPAPKEANGRWWKPWTYGDWRGGARSAAADLSATLPARGGSEHAQHAEGWGESQRKEIGAADAARPSTAGDHPTPSLRADPPLTGRVDANPPN